MAILFINKVPGDKAAFESEVKSDSSKLGIDPNDLMFVMNYETAGTFSPSKKNPKSSATGLIGFLDRTAKSLGTTTEALAKMTPVQQLDYVYKYLKPYKGDMVDYYTTYLAVFYPAALNKPDTYIFPEDVVNANPSFFHTGNTLADFKKGLDAIVYQQVPTEYYSSFFEKKRSFLQIYQRETVAAILIIALLVILFYVGAKAFK